MFILTLIGATIPAAISVGLRTLGSNGTSGHLTASHDILALQQEVSKDVDRATCMATGSAAAVGVCAKSLLSVAPCPSGAMLCVSWVNGSDALCHVAVYQQVTNALNHEVSITRAESKITAGTAVAVGAHNVTVLGGGTLVPAATFAAVDSDEPLTWGNILVRVTATRTNDTATLTLSPFVSDPSLGLSSVC